MGTSTGLLNYPKSPGALLQSCPKLEIYGQTWSMMVIRPPSLSGSLGPLSKAMAIKTHPKAPKLSPFLGGDIMHVEKILKR